MSFLLKLIRIGGTPILGIPKPPSCQPVRHGSANGFRTARKVYEPGDRIPLPRVKGRIKMEVPPPPVVVAEGSGKQNEPQSVTLFNATMSEIVNNNSKKKKKIALEGIRLIQDALLAKLKMEKLFLLKSIQEVPEKIKCLIPPEDVEIHRVGQKHMQVWSSLTTPPGVIGIFRRPEPEEVSSWNEQKTMTHHPKIPLTLICTDLREPGNLGSILRSAAGAGCKKVLLSKGCVDPWNEKVLRGGSGAQFRLPIISEVPILSIGTHLDVGVRSSCGDPEVSSTSVGIFLADSDTGTRSKFAFPSTSYSAWDYTKFGEIYLIVGGESEGIGDETLGILSSLKATYDNSRVPVTITRIHIPLENQVESLNVANALGIITFEIRRQFLSQHVSNLTSY